MSGWEIANAGAWIVSGLLAAWMLFDALKVGRTYDEDLLLSSREGEDELLEETRPSERRS